MPVASRNTAILRNTSEYDWEGRTDGQYLFCAPGDTITLAENVAKGIIGDWDSENEDMVAAEKDRVKMRATLVIERDDEGKPIRTMPRGAQLSLVRLVEPPEGNVQTVGADKIKPPQTILKQEIEPEFPGKPANRKPGRPKKEESASLTA